MASFTVRNIDLSLWCRARAKARTDRTKFVDVLERLLRAWLASSAILLIACSSADAQSLKLPTIVFSASAAADWATTFNGVQSGARREVDPLVAWASDRPGLMVASGAALDVAGVWAWNRYVGRRHPRLAAAGLYIAASARLYFVMRNLDRGPNGSRPVPICVSIQACR